MTQPSARDDVQPGRYEIRLQGRLEQRWSDWFEGLTLSDQGDGTTTLSGPVVDQAALHGLLRRIGDLGITLISLNVTNDTKQAQYEQPDKHHGQPRD